MPALPPFVQPCYTCLGLSVGDSLALSLLDLIAQNAGGLPAPVESFVSRSGITDETQIASVLALYIAAVAHGWWDKCDLIYPFVGGNATAHAQNLKSASFTLAWAGTVTHDANGITGNGVDGRGDTGYIPASSGQMLLNSTHVSLYRRNNVVVARTMIGAAGGAGSIQRIRTNATATTVTFSLNDGSTSVVTLTSSALMAAVRNDSGNKHIFTGPDDKVAVVNSVSLPVFALSILSHNIAGVFSDFSTTNLAGATAGLGMTHAEFLVMAADWQTFNAALGRSV